MLKTPLGDLEIKIDNNVIDYKYLTVCTNDFCKDLNGRFAIIVPFQPDKRKHVISCRILNYESSDEDGAESGENLELYSFYKGTVKLSIGMEGDTSYIAGKRMSDYDYDTEYLVDGVQYCLLPITQTSEYVFGVAWLDKVTKENDVQTWFGADPTLFWNINKLEFSNE